MNIKRILIIVALILVVIVIVDTFNQSLKVQERKELPKYTVNDDTITSLETKTSCKITDETKFNKNTFNESSIKSVVMDLNNFCTEVKIK